VVDLDNSKLANMKILPVLVLMAVPLPLSAVDIYLRTHDNKNCRVIGATFATPIVVTCAAAHNMAAGDRVWFSNIAGNFATNGLRYVEIPSATTLRLYSDAAMTVPVIGSGTWINGNNGANAGGYQIAGVVAPYTLQPSPRISWNPAGEMIEFGASVENGLLVNISDSSTTATATYSRAHGLAVGNRICIFGATDPDLNCSSTAGTSVYFTITAVPSPTTIQWVTASVTDAVYNNTNLTISSWAQGGNPAWIAVNSFRSFLTGGSPPAYTLGRRDYQKETASSLATICYLNRSDTEACTIAEHAINNPQTGWHNGGCDETIANCGDDAGDYASIGGEHLAYIYDLMKNTSYLDAGEKTAFRNAMLNDLGDSCTKLVPAIGAGSISVVGNEAVNGLLTGTGTNFLTSVTVGSILVARYNPADPISAAETIHVNAVIDNEHLTVNTSTSVPNTANPMGLYSIIDPRTSTSCGLWWFLKHHNGTPLAHPIYYPPVGGYTLSEAVDPINNMTQSKLHIAILFGLAMADEDPRAAILLSDASVWWMDYMQPTQRGQYTGMTQGGNNYYFARVAYMAVDIPTFWRNGFVGGPDWTGAGYIKPFQDAFRFLWHPNAAVGTRNWCVWAFGADADGTACWNGMGGHMISFPASSRISPASAETSKFMYWYNNVAGFNASTISAGNSYQANNIFKRQPPNPNVATTNYLSDPTQRLFRVAASDLTWCTEVGSTIPCPPTGSSGMAYMFSRSGWTSTTDSAVSYSSASFYSDHDTRRAGDYCIVKGNGLICGDSYAVAQSLGNMGNNASFGRMNMYLFGGLTTNQGQTGVINGNVQVQHYHAPILRWAGGANNDGRSDSAFAYVLSNLATTWQSGLTRQHRALLHYKRSGKQEHVIVWDDVLRTAAGTIEYFAHFVQDGESGEGTTSCPSGDTTCASVNTSKQVNTATAGSAQSVVTKFFAPTGSNMFLQVNAADGSYSGGLNHTYRVTRCGGTSSCGSVTALETFTAHQVSSGAVTTSSLTELNPSADWSGAQYTDLTYLHARGGSTFTSVPSFTTSATTDIIAAGLTPATYEVRLGGVAVSGCTAIVVITGDNTIYCPDVGAGAITIVQNGAGPDPIIITTTTLPDGTQAVPYSQALTLTGGTPAYNCSIISGSLPVGLSISVATISGTPSSFGLSSFTVSCTDSLGATPDTAALTINIISSGSPINITTTTLLDGTQGAAYSQTLTITGGTPPYNCSIISGALPTGLSISVATISGTPSSAGLSSFTVSCTDSVAGTPDTAALTILVNLPAASGAGGLRRGGKQVQGGKVF